MRKLLIVLSWLGIALAVLSFSDANLSIETIILALTVTLGIFLLILTIYVVSRLNQLEDKLLQDPKD